MGPCEQVSGLFLGAWTRYQLRWQEADRAKPAKRLAVAEAFVEYMWEDENLRSVHWDENRGDGNEEESEDESDGGSEEAQPEEDVPAFDDRISEPLSNLRRTVRDYERSVTVNVRLYSD